MIERREKKKENRKSERATASFPWTEREIGKHACHIWLRNPKDTISEFVIICSLRPRMSNILISLLFLRVYNPVSTLIKLWFNIDKSFNFDELQVRFILANITSLSGILRFYHLFTLCNSSLFILHHRRLIHNHHTETIYNKRSKYGHENSNINNQPFIHRKDGIKRITA